MAFINNPNEFIFVTGLKADMTNVSLRRYLYLRKMTFETGDALGIRGP